MNLLKLKLKMKRKKPEFKRRDSTKRKSVDDSWRRPKARKSHQRRKRKGQPKVVEVGYRKPKQVRGLHPSGYKIARVFNVNELEKYDTKIYAIQIASTVGKKKRKEIEEKAKELGFKILNAKFVKQ